MTSLPIKLTVSGGCGKTFATRSILCLVVPCVPHQYLKSFRRTTAVRRTAAPSTLITTSISTRTRTCTIISSLALSTCCQRHLGLILTIVHEDLFDQLSVEEKSFNIKLENPGNVCNPSLFLSASYSSFLFCFYVPGAPHTNAWAASLCACYVS